jgi:predicted transcriptional regulator
VEEHVRELGDLEKAVMEQMWATPDATTSREMVARLHPARGLAYTTVQTTLDRLVHKGWLARRMVNRKYVYEPTGTRAEWAAELMAEVLDDAEDRDAAIMHFVGHMEPGELKTLRAALQNAETGLA